jgi:hypothetical protein
VEDVEQGRDRGVGRKIGETLDCPVADILVLIVKCNSENLGLQCRGRVPEKIRGLRVPRPARRRNTSAFRNYAEELIETSHRETLRHRGARRGRPACRSNREARYLKCVLLSVSVSQCLCVSVAKHVVVCLKCGARSLSRKYVRVIVNRGLG